MDSQTGVLIAILALAGFGFIFITLEYWLHGDPMLHLRCSTCGSENHVGLNCPWFNLEEPPARHHS